MLKFFKKATINNERGFTLIELVIVIAIIGVLAVVTAPKLRSFVDKANGAGVTVDFNSTFKNNVKGYVIEKHVIPTEAQLATDLAQFVCMVGVGADLKPLTADDSNGVLTFINGTVGHNLFADGVTYDLSGKRVAYLSGEGGKKYAIVLNTASNKVSFVAGHVASKLTMQMVMDATGLDATVTTAPATGSTTW